MRATLMPNSKLFFLTITLMALAGCDSAGSSDELRLPPAASAVEIDVNNYVVTLDTTGALSNGRWESPDGSAGALFTAGLWMASESGDGVDASVIWSGANPTSNYTSNWDGDRRGVYYVRPSDVDDAGPNSDWPREHGAPVDADGRPRVYGDAMAWSALTGHRGHLEPEMMAPLTDVTIRQAVYGYEDAALRDVLFVQYVLANQSQRMISDLHIGFYADTDLSVLDCQHVGRNRTGYDVERGLSYTYPEEALDAGERACGVVVTGFAFLELPEGSGGLLGHRIMRKNSVLNPDFGEESVQEPGQFLFALKGLSNSGLPMEDPSTGTTTRFAFSGNPISGTGWLDEGGDARSLLSVQPISLEPGASSRTTLVLLTARGDSLARALAALGEKLDAVRAAEAYWRF